jgi:hypothetical protein
VTEYPGVLTYHNNSSRTGWNPSEIVLTPGNVTQSQFGKLFSYPVDGYVYAQPLYVANVSIPGRGFHNVLYVVTSHDSVYAFDADGRSAIPLWQTSFLSSGVTPIPSSAFGTTSGTIAKLFGPEIGITGTPVIDKATQTIYLVAATRENNTDVQRLHALDITTGVDNKVPVVIRGTVPGTGSGSDGAGSLSFKAHQNLQRAGLALANGKIYVAFGSHYDRRPYHGWVFAFSKSSLQRQAIFCVTPDGLGFGAGVWMGGAAPGVDAAGNIYISSGNGDFTADTGGTGYGNTVMKLSSTLAVLDWFAPANQIYLNDNDYDLGSGGTLLLPDQSGTTHPHELVMFGKDPSGTIYVLDREDLGRYNPAGDTQIVQSIPHQIGDGVNKPRSMPAYWNGRVYFIAMHDVPKQFTLTNGLLSPTPTARASTLFGFPGATPSISSKNSTNAILWAVENVSGAPAVLHAYSAANITIELYNSNQAGARDNPDIATTFSIPTIANGKVYIAGRTQVTVYGLFP